jgi:putative ABC transport system permease protein
MNALALIRMSFRSILRNRMRSLLTTLGVIIGVSSVIIMVAVGEGSQAAIRENIASMGTNLLQVRPPRGRFVANRLSVSDVEKIRAEAVKVAAVSGVVRSSVTAAGGSGYWTTTAYGAESAYPEIRNWEIASGEFFTDRDNAAKQKVAVIGTTVADELFEGVDPVGQQLRLGNTPFQIIGVLKSKGKTQMGDDQDNVVMVPLNTALVRLERNDFLNSIELSAASEKDMDAAQEEVDAILREAHRLEADEEADYQLFNQEEIIEVASSTARTLTVLLGAIAGVSLLVGGIGIMNIMLVSVTERTREIGIRLSVGARKSDIMKQFLTEAVVLSLMGGAAGIVLALTAVYALNEYWSIRADANPAFILLSGGFSAAVGVFFGWYPARKAAAMNPIDALRTD